MTMKNFQKNQPFLSICIPTYNRAHTLKLLLTSILHQDIPELEIIISNDASPDETDKIIPFFKRKFYNFTYVKQQKNLGFDANLLYVLRKAHGTYCWTIGDGESLEPHAISEVIKILKKNVHISFLLTNYTMNFLEKNKSNFPVCIKEKEDLLFATGQDFFSYPCKDYWGIGVLGAFCISFYTCVYKRQFLTQSLLTWSKEKYNHTFIIHAVLVLESIANKPVYFVHKPLITTIPDTFYSNIKRNDVFLKYIPQILMEQKKRNAYNISTIRKIIWYFKMRIFFLSLKDLFQSKL